MNDDQAARVPLYEPTRADVSRIERLAFRAAEAKLIGIEHGDDENDVIYRVLQAVEAVNRVRDRCERAFSKAHTAPCYVRIDEIRIVASAFWAAVEDPGRDVSVAPLSCAGSTWLSFATALHQLEMFSNSLCFVGEGNDGMLGARSAGTLLKIRDRE